MLQMKRNSRTMATISGITFFITFFCIFSQINGNCSSQKLSISIEEYSRMLQIAWETESVGSGDWIAIYDGDIATWLSNQTGLYSFTVTNSSGRQITPLSAHNISIDLDVQNRQPIKYSACYWRTIDNNGVSVHEALTTTRFYTFPDWQKNYWNIIKDKALVDIFIPGTAHSACFNTENPHSIISQLAMGIRYLDLRVSMHSFELYAAYSDCCQTLLDDVLDDLLYFISKSEKEVVILDITKVKKTESKFLDNNIENLQNQTFFEKIIHFFTSWGSDSGNSCRITIDDYILGYLNERLKVNGEPVWVERVGDDRELVYNKKTFQDILVNGSRIIISYPNDKYTGKYQSMVWKSYMMMFNWDISDSREYFMRQHAFPEYRMPEQILQVNTKRNSSKNGRPNLSTNSSQLNGDTSVRDWGIDTEYNLRVNILLGPYFRHIGNVRTAFVWNERLAKKSGLCDEGPSPDNSTWYSQHNIV